MTQIYQEHGRTSDDVRLATLVRKADGLYEEACIWQSRLLTYGIGMGDAPHLTERDGLLAADLAEQAASLQSADAAAQRLALAELLHVSASCKLRDFFAGAENGSSHDVMRQYLTGAEEALKQELRALQDATDIESTIVAARARALYAQLLAAVGVLDGASELVREAVVMCIPAVKDGSREAFLLQADVQAQWAALDLFAPDAAENYEMAADGYAYFDDDPDVLLREAEALMGATFAHGSGGRRREAEEVARRAVSCAWRLDECAAQALREGSSGGAADVIAVSMANAELAMMCALCLGGQHAMAESCLAQALDCMERVEDTSLTLLPANTLHTAVSVLALSGAREPAREAYGLAVRYVAWLEKRASDAERRLVLDQARSVLRSLAEEHGFLR